jgi:hypothetical protein
MQNLKPGDRVVLIERVPPQISSFTKLERGDIGEVVKICSCMQNGEVLKDLADTFTPKVIERFKRMELIRVAFDHSTGCLPREWLRKIEDDGDGMVDWSKVPKPWEIGVSDIKKN